MDIKNSVQFGTVVFRRRNYLLDDEDMSLMRSFERCVKISVCLGFYLKQC